MFGVTEQMRLDSSGNLGLGVTPNTSSAAGKTFQIRNTLIEDNTNGYAIWRYNNYFDGGASDRYIANGAACSFQLAGNAFRWYQAASGTAGNAISFTQAMTLDASGNLGVGTTSPVYRLDVHATSPAFRLKTTAATTGFIADQNNSTLNVSLINYDNAALLFGTNANERARIDSSGNFGIGTSSPVSKLSINGTNSGSPNNTLTGSWLNVGSSLSSGFGMRQKSSDPGISGSGFPFQMAVIGGLPFEIYTADAQPLVFGTSATERARIDSSGNLRIGTTAHLIASNRRLTVFGQAGTELVVTGTTGEPCAEMWQQATSGNNVFTTFNTEASLTQRGSITYNRAGGLTVYNTTSDYRAKDVYGPVVDSGAVIDSVPVYMGKMKGATQERPMFIAHETPPYAHTGEKDAVDADDNPVYQQMDNSALVPVMWAEIQSLRQRLAAAGI